MRYAALAFGVVAGLVASFILALGGLDAAAIFHADRPMQLASFGLYIIANLGVLGAGIVLAAPLVGAILFLVGAISWVGAAIFLRHGPDFVMLTPPALLLVALAFSVAAYLRRSRAALPQVLADDIDDEQDEEADEDEDEEEPEQRVGPTRRRAPPPPAPAPAPEELELPEVAVGAGFFGQGGTAMPLQPEAPPEPRPVPQRPVAQPYRPPQPQQQQAAQRPSPQFQARQAEVPPPRAQAQQMPLRGPADPQIRANEDPDDWRPGRRRPAPPRATPMFRQPEDLEEEDEYEDDEESGFSRFSRVAASILTFCLYTALAGGAALLVWNARDIGHPTASKVETPSVAAISSSAEPAAPVLSSSREAAQPAPQPAASVAAADLPALTSEFPPSDAGLALLAQPTDTPPPAASAAPASSEPAISVAAASEPPPAAEEPVVPTVGAMMPDDMPARMAAERLKPAPKPTPPAPLATDTPLLLDNNTGL